MMRGCEWVRLGTGCSRNTLLKGDGLSKHSASSHFYLFILFVFIYLTFYLTANGVDLKYIE